MRRTWPDEDRPNDFVFRIDEQDAGRCYELIAASYRRCWLWTVYGTSMRGLVDTLEEAQRRFKGSDGRLD
jgi:hypothetical protein